jgi:hypothetical protein
MGVIPGVSFRPEQLGVCQVNGVTGWLVLFSACRQAAVESDVEGVKRLVPPVGPTLTTLASGIKTADHQVQALKRGLLVREVSPCLDGSTKPRAQAFDRVRRADHRADLRIKVEEGVNFDQALFHSLTLRRITVFPRVAELDEPVQSRGFGRCGVDGLEVTGDPRPVLGAGIPKAVAQQVHDARLDNRGRPDLRHRVGQSAQAVADEDATILRAPVFDLGEHVGASTWRPRRPRRPTGARMSRSPSTVTASAM